MTDTSLKKGVSTTQMAERRARQPNMQIVITSNLNISGSFREPDLKINFVYAERPMNGISLPGKVRYLCLLCSVYTRSGAEPVGTVIVVGKKRPGCEADRSPSICAGVIKAWRYSSTL
jgi:hypothetical protein